MRSKLRSNKLGEVFTPSWLVRELIDKIPDLFFEDKTKTYLDPACGSGNILVEVLNKKIQHGSTPLQALQTTYGVDIMPDNVLECRKRLFEVAYKHDPSPTKKWETILLTNIRCANSLEKPLEEIFNVPPDKMM